MLIQLLTQHPEALGTIAARSPVWVWALLAGLIALGIAQMARRAVSLKRVALMPIAWVAFSLYGMVSAFGGGGGGQFGMVLLAWLGAMATVSALAMRFTLPSGTRFDPATRRLDVPGSVVPLLLILGIFLTKYAVGVELALQPAQGHTLSFALPVALLYGVFNGIFVARALRLLRLAGWHLTVRGAGAGIGSGARLWLRRDPW